MRTFKKGDVVTIANSAGGHKFEIGQKVVLCRDEGSGSFYAKNNCEDEYGWYVVDSNFKEFDEVKESRIHVKNDIESLLELLHDNCVIKMYKAGNGKIISHETGFIYLNFKDVDDAIRQIDEDPTCLVEE